MEKLRNRFRIPFVFQHMILFVIVLAYGIVHRVD